MNEKLQVGQKVIETYISHKFTLRDLMDIEPDDRKDFFNYFNSLRPDIEIVRNRATQEITEIRLYETNEKGIRMQIFYGNVVELVRFEEELRFLEKNTDMEMFPKIKLIKS